MFGNKKMYKRGLSDAMSAYEGFSKKQSDALDALRREVAAGKKSLEDALNGLGDELYGIYDYLTAKEKAALYHLSTPMDIKQLDQTDKQLLIAILYQLADDEGRLLTDHQRTYLRSIQRYLGITNPQTTADLSTVGDVDSIEVQKAILQAVLEFLYLQEGDEITDDQEDFLSNFSLNRKQYTSTESTVSRLFNAVGAEGLAEKYGPDPQKGSTAAVTDEAVNDFEKQVRCLRYITVFDNGGYCDLDPYGDDAQVYAYNEDAAFRDRGRALQTGQRVVSDRYNRATDYLEQALSASRNTSCFSSFKEDFTNSVEELQTMLKKLSNESSEKVVDKISGLLVTAKVIDKARNVSSTLMSKYTLKSVFSYYNMIEIECDGDTDGLEGGLLFFAKIVKAVAGHYGYLASDAICAIRDDTEKCCELFLDDFNSQMQEYITSSFIEPIVALLPELRNALRYA